MGEGCRTFGTEKSCILDFGWEIRRYERTWKTPGVGERIKLKCILKGQLGERGFG